MARQTKTARMFSTHVDLPEKKREALVEQLNATLADLFDLYSQVKQAHWNVKGSGFIQLHELFDETAAEVLGFVDEVAERATALGGYACGTARMAAGASRLPEYPVEAEEGLEHVQALVERFGEVAGLLRKGIDESDELGDAGTADLYTQMSRAVDKRLWFLEAFVQGGE